MVFDRSKPGRRSSGSIVVCRCVKALRVAILHIEGSIRGALHHCHQMSKSSRSQDVRGEMHQSEEITYKLFIVWFIQDAMLVDLQYSSLLVRMIQVIRPEA